VVFTIKAISSDARLLLLVREKVVRVRKRTYHEPMKLGSMADDFDDVITRLVKFWNGHHRND
jgi:hypothetical protein